ncbi:MAG: sensor histidine kinase [Candidatus Saccharimonadales bacterium]
MIRSAVLRLTLAYLAILVVLTLGFSFLLYNISVHELNEEIRRPNSYELVQPGLFLDYNRFRDDRFSEARSHLISNLLILNLGTLVLGAMVSYGLAKKSIQPIEDALQAQSRFAADASHELRTPLTALQTEIEVALRDKKLTVGQARAQLTSNLEEVIKLRTLSDRLLKLARDEEDIEIKKIDLKPAVQKVINQAQALADNKKIKFANHAGKLQVMGNSQHLEDCLSILLDNAIKYSDKQSSVTIKTGTVDKFGYVSVRDQGQGIKPVDLPHIFDRFYRADNSRHKDNASGYGLGLSIAHKIIEAQNGQIEVQSTPGKGSTFTVKLPLPHKK